MNKIITLKSSPLNEQGNTLSLSGSIKIVVNEREKQKKSQVRKQAAITSSWNTSDHEFQDVEMLTIKSYRTNLKGSINNQNNHIHLNNYNHLDDGSRQFLKPYAMQKASFRGSTSEAEQATTRNRIKSNPNCVYLQQSTKMLQNKQIQSNFKQQNDLEGISPEFKSIQKDLKVRKQTSYFNVKEVEIDTNVENQEINKNVENQHNFQKGCYENSNLKHKLNSKENNIEEKSTKKHLRFAENDIKNFERSEESGFLIQNVENMEVRKLKGKIKEVPILSKNIPILISHQIPNNSDRFMSSIGSFDLSDMKEPIHKNTSNKPIATQFDKKSKTSQELLRRFSQIKGEEHNNEMSESIHIYEDIQLNSPHTLNKCVSQNNIRKEIESAKRLRLRDYLYINQVVSKKCQLKRIQSIEEDQSIKIQSKTSIPSNLRKSLKQKINKSEVVSTIHNEIENDLRTQISEIEILLENLNQIKTQNVNNSQDGLHFLCSIRRDIKDKLIAPLAFIKRTVEDEILSHQEPSNLSSSKMKRDIQRKAEQFISNKYII